MGQAGAYHASVALPQRSEPALRNEGTYRVHEITGPLSQFVTQRDGQVLGWLQAHRECFVQLTDRVGP